MGMGYSYSDLIARISVYGGGVGLDPQVMDEQIVLRPVTPASFVAWSPPGALNTHSVSTKTIQQLGMGDNTLFTANSIAVGVALGFQVTYFIMRPLQGATNYKILKGAAGDTGVALYPDKPLILAVPNPVPASYMVIINCPNNFTETIFTYIL